MNFSGIFIFVLAVVVFNWIARPVEAFLDALTEWRNSSSQERFEIAVCAVVTIAFFVIICSAPSLYQTYFK